MKFIKKYESNSNQDDILDIIDILIEFKDDGHILDIESAKGFIYTLTDDFSNFRFKRYEDDKELSFIFKVNLKKMLEYTDAIKYINEKNHIIKRLNSYGWLLNDFILSRFIPKYDNMMITSLEYKLYKKL
jgi:hypothetical protein